jgi:hypothetical protein
MGLKLFPHLSQEHGVTFNQTQNQEKGIAIKNNSFLKWHSMNKNTYVIKVGSVPLPWSQTISRSVSGSLSGCRSYSQSRSASLIRSASRTRRLRYGESSKNKSGAKSGKYAISWSVSTIK